MRLILAVRAWFRRFLGVEQEVAALKAALDATTALSGRMVEQLNRTTFGAADTAERLHYYEEHVESIRFHAARLKSANSVGVKPNGAGRIHLLGEGT